MARKIAGQDQRKLYIRFGRVFFNISWYLCSFGLASFVVRENISLLQWIAAGSFRKSSWERLGGIKVVSMMEMWQISWSEDVWQGKLDAPEPRGLRWRAMLQDHMARRTCFREQYYTGTRRYICVREDCRQYEAETMYIFVMVFLQYLWIDQFVWARVLCGTIYYQSASVDCSGTIQKIYMRKI